MSNIKKIKDYFNDYDIEVHDIQADDFSTGIFNGWVIYEHNLEYYEIDYNDCLYCIYENKDLEDILELSKLYYED